MIYIYIYIYISHLAIGDTFFSPNRLKKKKKKKKKKKNTIGDNMFRCLKFNR
jgi:hypothetical protein